MDENFKRLVEQIYNMGKEGIFGEEVKTNSRDIDSFKQEELHNYFVELINDICQLDKPEDKEFNNILNILIQVLIVCYRESKKVDPEVATAYLLSLIVDYPNTEGTCMLPRWNSLNNAHFAYKEAIRSNSQLLVWQQIKKLFQASNEFLNGLLDYLTITWRCSLGKNFSLGIFKNNYAVKLKQFSDLTDGEDGPFYLIIRICQPEIRNAIAHEKIWYDAEQDKVRYINKYKQQDEIDLIDFIGYAVSSGQIGQAYFVAMISIFIYEYACDKLKSKLPTHIYNVLSHK